MTDPTSRALTLLGLLESRPVWSGEVLAERLGVTTRTVRRDVERLRRLGYTVEAEVGGGGGYSLGRGQVLPPLLLDEDEAVTTTLALTGAAMHAGGQAQSALRALAKIREVMPGPLRERVDELRDSVRVSTSADVADVGVLLTCAEAVRRRVRLTFGYRDRRGAATERRVEPHRLLARSGVWRLVAFDLEREDWRTFRLERMSMPEAGTWRFAPRPEMERAVAAAQGPTPPEAWRHEVRAIVRAPLEEVARFGPHLLPHMTALPDGTCEFLSGADDPRDAARWLAQLPADFTVLGDNAVRAACARLGRLLSDGADVVADPKAVPRGGRPE